MMEKVKRPSREGLLFMLIMLVVVISVLCVTIKVTATPNNQRDIQVKSVLIEEGDTLWSIASENMSSEYGSMDEYVDAIKECNHISSDYIYEGNYLIVPYYQ